MASGAKRGGCGSSKPGPAGPMAARLSASKFHCPPSPDYGVDGSALEIFNSASDVRIHHNVVLEADSVGYFHNSAGSTYGVQVQDV